MDKLEISCPQSWPLLPPANTPYEWQGTRAKVSWIVRKKIFLFRVPSCLGGAPVFPNLITCRADGRNNRRERFRVAKYFFAGRKYVLKHGGALNLDRNTVFVALDLIRIEKAEFNLLLEEGPSIPRGRRPLPVLEIDNFAPTQKDRAALTHWMQNPHEDITTRNPYAESAKEMLIKIRWQSGRPDIWVCNSSEICRYRSREIKSPDATRHTIQREL